MRRVQESEKEMNEYKVRCVSDGPWYGYERIERAYSAREAMEKASKMWDCDAGDTAVVHVNAKTLKAPREDRIDWLRR